MIINALNTCKIHKVLELLIFQCVAMQILVAMGGHLKFWMIRTSCDLINIFMLFASINLVGIDTIYITLDWVVLDLLAFYRNIMGILAAILNFRHIRSLPGFKKKHLLKSWKDTCMLPSSAFKFSLGNIANGSLWQGQD